MFFCVSKDDDAIRKMRETQKYEENDKEWERKKIIELKTRVTEKMKIYKIEKK